MHEATPPTWSHRFDTMFQMRPIAGVIEWGGAACWAHNRLQLTCLKRKDEQTKAVWEVELMQPGVDLSTLDWRSYTKFLRWFRYGATHAAGHLLAVEEWTNHASKTDHQRKIVIFDTVSGEELTGPVVESARELSDMERVMEAIKPENRS